MRMKLKLGIHAKDNTPTKICFLLSLSNCFRYYGNLKFPQTYNEKLVEIGISAVSIGIFDYFYSPCSLSSSPCFI